VAWRRGVWRRRLRRGLSYNSSTFFNLVFIIFLLVLKIPYFPFLAQFCWLIDFGSL